VQTSSTPGKRFFDNAIQSKGEDIIRDEQDAQRFLNAVVSFEDHVELLSRLISSPHGLECLRQALSISFDQTLPAISFHIADPHCQGALLNG
jgi:hypothetical protein